MENTPVVIEEIIGTALDITNVDYKSVMTKGAHYFEKKRQDTFNEFNKQLFLGIADKEKIEYEKRFKVTEEQYYKLLEAAIEDDEKEKSMIYANVYRSILNNTVEKKNYAKLIRLAKEVPYSALKLLPYFFIYNTYEVKNKTFNDYVDVLEKDFKYELKILDQNNIIDLPKGELLFNDSKIRLTNIYDEVIKSFFTDNELQPEAFELEIEKNQ